MGAENRNPGGCQSRGWGVQGGKGGNRYELPVTESVKGGNRYELPVTESVSPRVTYSMVAPVNTNVLSV